MRQQWEWPNNFCEFRVVYGLVGPDGIVRYIGCCKNPTSRLAQHLRTARKGKGHPVHEWMRSVLAAGGEISQVVINRLGGEWAERILIGERSLAGEPLLNVAHNDAIFAEKWRRNVACREERRRASKERLAARRTARLTAAAASSAAA